MCGAGIVDRVGLRGVAVTVTVAIAVAGDELTAPRAVCSAGLYGLGGRHAACRVEAFVLESFA